MQISITTAAMRNISLQPSQSPTYPLMTREARMPVRSPDSTIPIFLLLFLGAEYCPAIGMKNCGITEQAPRKREAPQRSHTLCAKAMMMAMMAATVMLVTMMRRRE